MSIARFRDASEDKRAARRGYAIHFYCGPNGGGKSALMVHDTMPSLEAGRRVLSTVRITDWTDPRPCPGCDDPGHIRPVFDWAEGPQLHAHMRPKAVVGVVVHDAAHPLYTRLTDWRQVMEARDTDILLDEVAGSADSRSSSALPKPVGKRLQELRRYDVFVRASAPAFARADLILRETAQAVTFCEGSWSVPVERDGAERIWRRRRLSRARTYDATLFDDFTAGKLELSPEVRDKIWLPRLRALSAYDTYDNVTSVGAATESGACMACGGSRPVPKCKCGDHGSSPASSDRTGTRARTQSEHVADLPALPERTEFPSMFGRVSDARAAARIREHEQAHGALSDFLN